MRFMESGHSYLVADSMHATIDKSIKHLLILTTRVWELQITSACKNPPFVVNLNLT